jgi:NhaA family Na+:H+ antiporter
MNKTTKNYTRVEPLAAILLFLGATFALIISNTGLNDDYLKYINIPISIRIGEFSLSMPLIKWINDGLMALFFLVLTLEAKFHILEKEFLDKSYLPLAVVSAIGGAIFPALIYCLVTSSSPILTKGWAIPIATDTAFVLGIISFFSHKIPNNVRIFILSLSIIDDVIAVLVLAIFYTPVLHIIPLLAAICFVIALSMLNFLNVRMLLPYILIGIGLWLSLIEAGVHGTLAGVLLGLMIPLHVNSHKRVSYSPLKSLESRLRPLVEFVVLPLFAFFNVHIAFKEITYADFSSLLILGITIGLFLGKPLGIILSSYVCIKLKLFKLPKSFNWQTFFAVSSLCGIGFTFSLFIGLLSFDDSFLIHQMKIGVLIGSLLSGGLGVILLCFVPNRHHK